MVWEFWMHKKLKLSRKFLRHVSLNTLKPYYPVAGKSLRTLLFNVILSTTH